MKIKDLSFVLNKLNEQGFGEVEILSGDVMFEMNLYGIHMNDFKHIFPENPFPNAEITGNGISPCVYIEDDSQLSDEFDIHKKCMENRRTINENS